MMASSITTIKQQSYHPILEELHLIPVDPDHKKQGSHNTIVSPLDLLNYLLTTHVLKPKILREAHNAILQERCHQRPTATKQNDGTIAGTTEDIVTQQQQHGNKKTQAFEQPPQPPKVQQQPQPTHRTRHIALRFYYDGGNYTGLAQNVGQDYDKSVEKEIFRALIKAQLVPSREDSGYSRCGRTDRGVSAAGQVVAFQHMKSAIPMDATWDKEGTEQISSPDQLPKNHVETITAWVLPKKKHNNKKNKNKNIKNGDDVNTTDKTTPLGTQDVISATSLPSTQRQEKILSEYPYAKILNNLLPSDIRILGWCPVSEDFSARFSATTRTYRYFFIPRQMNLTIMQKGLDLLVGRHDFRNFCKMDVEKVYNFERVIHSAQVVIVDQDDDTKKHNTNENSHNYNTTGQNVCYLLIVGQAFLWHQIRCIASILFLVGQGLEPPSVITELLNVEKYPGKPGYPLAPERPLVLHHCGYPNLHMGYSVQNIWTTSCQLEQQWEELVLSAARIRNSIQSWKEDVTILKDDLIQFATGKLKERQKKRQRHVGHYGGSADSSDATMIDSSFLKDTTEDFISWKDALVWLKNQGFVPDSNGLTTALHIPLLQRSMGTTYDEKVSALQKSDKRRQKYEDNVIKKRKTAAEDAKFYQHMAQQGGTGM